MSDLISNEDEYLEKIIEDEFEWSLRNNQTVRFHRIVTDIKSALAQAPHDGHNLPTEDPDTNTRLSKAQSGCPQSSKADTEIERIMKGLIVFGHNSLSIAYQDVPELPEGLKPSEAKAAIAALIESEIRRAVYKMHEDIMELDKLVLGNEQDVAFNYARVHRWIDSYIERKLEAGSGEAA